MPRNSEKRPLLIVAVARIGDVAVAIFRIVLVRIRILGLTVPGKGFSVTGARQKFRDLVEARGAGHQVGADRQQIVARPRQGKTADRAFDAPCDVQEVNRLVFHDR